MKTLILAAALTSAFLTLPARGQNLACFTDTARPGFNAELVTYGIRTPIHRPQWSPAPASSATIGVNAAGIYSIPLFMPAAGRCVGAFKSRNAAETAAVALGNYVGVETSGDNIELIFADDYNARQFAAGRGYAAAWSSDPRPSGSFDVYLPAGSYWLILNNRAASFAAKSVNIILGGPAAFQEASAPSPAPSRRRTGTNQTYSESNDTPPKLKKSPKTKP